MRYEDFVSYGGFRQFGYAPLAGADAEGGSPQRVLVSPERLSAETSPTLLASAFDPAEYALSFRGTMRGEPSHSRGGYEYFYTDSSGVAEVPFGRMNSRVCFVYNDEYPYRVNKDLYSHDRCVGNNIPDNIVAQLHAILEPIPDSMRVRVLPVLFQQDGPFLPENHPNRIWIYYSADYLYIPGLLDFKPKETGYGPLINKLREVFGTESEGERMSKKPRSSSAVTIKENLPKVSQIFFETGMDARARLTDSRTDARSARNNLVLAAKRCAGVKPLLKLINSREVAGKLTNSAKVRLNRFKGNLSSEISALQEAAAIYNKHQKDVKEMEEFVTYLETTKFDPTQAKKLLNLVKKGVIQRLRVLPNSISWEYPARWYDPGHNIDPVFLGVVRVEFTSSAIERRLVTVTPVSYVSGERTYGTWHFDNRRNLCFGSFGDVIDSLLSQGQFTGLVAEMSRFIDSANWQSPVTSPRWELMRPSSNGNPPPDLIDGSFFPISD